MRPSVRTVVDVVSVAVIVCGTLTIAALLDAPGWAYPPLVLVLGVGAVATCVSRRRPDEPGRRRHLLLGVGAVMVSLVTICVAILTPRLDTSTGPDEAVVAAATDTVRALYSVPADAAERARRVAFLRDRLTSPLLPETTNATPTPDPPTPIPLPDVQGATSQLDVQRVGVARADAEGARLLVFGVVRVRAPGLSPPEASAPIARSVVLRRVDATWRVADVYPVGPGG